MFINPYSSLKYWITDLVVQLMSSLEIIPCDKPVSKMKPSGMESSYCVKSMASCKLELLYDLGFRCVIFSSS